MADEVEEANQIGPILATILEDPLVTIPLGAGVLQEGGLEDSAPLEVNQAAAVETGIHQADPNVQSQMLPTLTSDLSPS